MHKLYLILIFTLLSVFSSAAFSLESVRFHCEKDTAEINNLLREGIDAELSSPGEYMLFYGKKLLGTPYVAHTLEGDKEYFTINIDELDCTTFVETLIALTRSTLEKSPTWYSYASNLERVRYKNGKMDGYASRLHYISAWIIENTSRGFFTEVTSMIPRAETQVKSLDYMSQHRDQYPALANDSTFREIKQFESGYNMHLFPYISKNNLIKKDVIAALEDGDIICLTTKTDGLDVSHLGIIVFEDGKPHLLNASSIEKKVVIDKYDLYDMIRSNRNCTGIRVLRVNGL